jgi:2,3-dihydroxybenzoate decarboxylase
MPAKRNLMEYFDQNFYVTTSGQFNTPALICTMLQMGSDKIMFSTDYPFETVPDACSWFDACPISEPDRLKIGRTNITKLLKMDI